MEKQNIKDKKMMKSKIAVILRICLVIFISVMWIILQSFLGNKNSSEYYMVLVGAIIIVVFIMHLLISKFLIFILNISSSAFDNVPQEKRCQHFSSVCCVNLAIDSLKSAYRIRLDDNVATRYGLYSEEQLIEKEGNINQGEVWIVSYDLTAEALENQQARMREMNIKKGIKYRLFYINDDAQKYGELQDNIKILDNRYNRKMKLYPYEKPISIFSFLFSLFGIIMFTDEDGLAKEAFFILYSSNDKIKEPIYIKMSYCMGRKYNKILYSIKQTARNPREKNCGSGFAKIRKRIRKGNKLFRIQKMKGGK